MFLLKLYRSITSNYEWIDPSQAERLGRSCLFIVCYALSLARTVQAERDNDHVILYHVKNMKYWRRLQTEFFNATFSAFFTF